MGFLGVLLLIVGLVFLIVSPPLFAAAHTVGVIILAVLAALLIWQVIALLLFRSAAKRMKSSFERDYGRW